jgi:CheY-like chemotaxis protein
MEWHMSLGSAHILLVDDDGAFIKFLATVLKDEFGHRVETVGSGEEAVERLLNGRTYFDLIFLDYFMPGMTGLDVMRWMNEKHIGTPVILLTGAGNEQVAVEAMKLGAYDYLRKEESDIQHFGTVIEATRERHLFRISKELEDDRAREIRLNDEATEKLRWMINSVTPSLNSALANIAVELEINGLQALESLREGPEKEKVKGILESVRSQVGVLESGISTLLRLYQLVYAHYAMIPAIELMKKEVEEKAGIVRK